MTMRQFKSAYQLAELIRQEDEFNSEEYQQAQQALIGYGYEKKHCTLRQYAIIFNAQTIMLNGLRDSDAVNAEIAYAGNITIIDQ